MGQNASSDKGNDSANGKKSRPSNSRRKSLELPDINGLAVAPPRRATPQVTPAPIPIPSNSQNPATDHVESIMVPPPNDDNRQAAMGSGHGYPAHTPETHILSSIPLGINLPSESEPNGIEEMTDGLVPTTIRWRERSAIPPRHVQLAGTFESSWSRRINMIQDSSDSSSWTTTVRLKPGTHRLKFIIDDQWKCSDDLPTATDNDGHLVNYLEVANSTAGWDPSEESSAPEASRHQTPFGDIIPPHLLHSALLEEQYLNQQIANPPPIPHPAALPRHLEKVILNTHRHTRDRAVMDGIRDDNSVLPIPNHVVLNHLGTSAIKNGVLAVATTMRYHQKYISTLYFKPVSTSS